MIDAMTLVLTEAEAIAGQEADEPLSMDETAFRAFHAWTSRPLRAYLVHLTGEVALADDLVQEAYLRMLRGRLPEMTDDQRKSYLFKVATNLVRDHFRSPASRTSPLPEALAARDDAGRQVRLRADLDDAMKELKPRHREMLWLAYVEGSTHQEIAEATGMKVQSVRPLLFRARQRLAEILRSRGFCGPAAEEAP